MFTSILDKTTGLTISSALLCTAASLLLGLVIAGVYMFRNRASRNFATALALMPVIVQVVIMMVNGEIGTGVAVMGAFSLVRFRSAPGNAKDICCIFFAMAIGIATGMGYLTFAACATVIIALMLMLLTAVNFGGREEHELRVTLPGDADYTEVFEEVFDKYTTRRDLSRVKSSNDGESYELRYAVTLKSGTEQKQFIDAIRAAGGKTVILCRAEGKNGEQAL